MRADSSGVCANGPGSLLLAPLSEGPCRCQCRCPCGGLRSARGPPCCQEACHPPLGIPLAHRGPTLPSPITRQETSPSRPSRSLSLRIKTKAPGYEYHLGVAEWEQMSPLQMHTPACTSQCRSRQTPARTQRVHRDAPGQRHGATAPSPEQPTPRSSQTGQVIRGLR